MRIVAVGRAVCAVWCMRCDTLSGNSGSPVIRISDRQVIGLHHAGDNRTGFNLAIPMALILENSAILKAAFPDPGLTPDPEAEAFAALAAAMAINAAAPQILALRDVQTTFPGTRAATSAAQFLAVLDMPALRNAPRRTHKT